MSAVPPTYTPAASFATLAQTPITTAGLPGAQMDSENTRISASINALIARLSEIQRDDGPLMNEVVSLASLHPAVLALLNADGERRGLWETDTEYAVGDFVTESDATYVCATAHTSGVFNADKAAGIWMLVQAQPAAGALTVDVFTGDGVETVYELSGSPAGGENSTQVFISGVYQNKDTYAVSGTTLTFSTAPPNGTSIEVVAGIPASVVTVSDEAVTTLKIADDAVTTAKIADSAVTAAKLADSSITRGKVSGSILPAGVVLPFGGTTAPNGFLMCYGQAVSRTTYADLFAEVGTNFGAGDGSTTFNVPDLRGRTFAGKDDMGGVAANRLSSAGTGTHGINGATLGAAGGVDRHTLTTAQMPTHSHSFTGVTVGVGIAGGSGFGGGTLATVSAGSSEAHPNVQPTIVLNAIISY